MNLLSECDQADDFIGLFHGKEKASCPQTQEPVAKGIRFMLQSSVEMPLKIANEEKRCAQNCLYEKGIEQPQQLEVTPPEVIYDHPICICPEEMHAVSDNGSVYAGSEPADFGDRHHYEIPGDCRRRWSTNTLEKQSSEGQIASGKQLSKNQTKNIPKNYGKAIITFVERNRSRVTRLLQTARIDYADLLNELKRHKKGINTIADLRNLWTQSKYAQMIRILSNLFLRKYALQYIFNSRVSNFGSHIKYRQKLREALRDPVGFRNIKDY